MTTTFYLVTLGSETKITYAVKPGCKRPKQTKAYKTLLHMLDQDEVHAIGYHTDYVNNFDSK